MEKYFKTTYKTIYLIRTLRNKQIILHEHNNISYMHLLTLPNMEVRKLIKRLTMETFIIVIFIHFHTLFIPTFFFISANDHQKGNIYDISKQCIYKDGHLQKRRKKYKNVLIMKNIHLQTLLRKILNFHFRLSSKLSSSKMEIYK